MTLQHPFSNYEKRFVLLLIVAGIGVMFYQIGIYPLIQEEPRRALIALEMDLQDNLWVPTQTGNLYYRKPPFFNWMIILTSKIFGGYSEFAVRIWTLGSHIVLSFLVFHFFKKRTQFEVAVLTALCYFFSVDIYFYFTNLGEIDLFYALLTSSSIMLIFYFDEKEKYWWLFLSVYTLTACCLLTKGLSALPYTALTLLTYFVAKNKFKKVFSIQHFAGIGLFVMLLVGYFYAYSKYADVEGWWSTLLAESVGRANQAGLGQRLIQVFEYPIQTIKNVLPAALLLPAIFTKGKKNKIDKVWFWIILLNFSVYWFSGEGKARYIYPLFPFICYWLIERVAPFEKQWLYQFLKVVAISALIVATIATPIMPFVDELSFLPNRWLFVLIAEGVLVLLWFGLLRLQIRPLLIVMGALVVGKLGISYILPQSRAHQSGSSKDKALAYEIIELTGDAPIYRWGDVRISLTTAFYLEKEREQILYQKKEKAKDAYYLIYQDQLSELPAANEVLAIEFRGDIIYLVKP